MARRTSAPDRDRVCIVFEYGCLPPVSGKEAAVAEMRRRNNFWNALVEIERKHQEAARPLVVLDDEAASRLRTRLKEIREEIKARRKRERSGRADVEALLAEADGIKAQLAALREQSAEARKQKREEAKDALADLETARRAAVKEAQHRSGLYWCNYGEVLDNYAVARVRAMKERSDKKRSELRFHRWDGSGKVTVRYQNGLPVPDVFGCDTRLQINPVPQEAWTSPIRAERRRLARTKIRLRVGSNEDRSPVWLELPMVMHRPLPANGIVRTASIVRERVGRKFRWKAVITVALGLTAVTRQGEKRSGTIAIDIGWRAVAEGLRVAYWHDDAGNEGQLVLGPEITEAVMKLNDLKSIRDKHFNEMKTKLGQWVVAQAMEHKNIPDWLWEEAKTLAAWRSQGRLVALIHRWRKNRFDGDEEIFAELEVWRKKENHLYDWEANQRDQVQRRRREEYRKFAAVIAAKYGAVVLEDFDLRHVARKPAPEAGTQGAVPADRQRVIASCGELRLAIENACRREGVRIVRVPAQNTTRECYVCGHLEKFDAASHLFHRCEECGALWDQDANAARVLLKRGMLISSVSGPSSRGS